ncbi:MAG: hypothetical protein ACLPN1_09805, partial [Dissulfurispiraceae bacterium]
IRAHIARLVKSGTARNLPLLHYREEEKHRKDRVCPKVPDMLLTLAIEGKMPTRPLERVKISPQMMDIIVVDEQLNAPIGNLWLTIAVDEFSGHVLGMEPSLTPPDDLSVMKCVAHMWNAHDIPKVLMIDCGQEFRSSRLNNFFLELGIFPLYVLPLDAKCKGNVERSFGKEEMRKNNGAFKPEETDLHDAASAELRGKSWTTAFNLIKF